MTLTVRAPAKINLHLGVGAPREDGFHPLDTVYQAIGLVDDVTVSDGPGVTVALEVAGHVRGEGVPLGADNIVTRAARLLARHHGREAAAHVLIEKAIPVAGGMAGGSADAAATLLALDRWWDLHTRDDDLLAIAAELGSDVPFALVGGTARGLGRGELVEPVADTATWWWVAVPSGQGLSTPAVYRHFDVLRPDAPAEPPSADRLLAALASGDPSALAAALHNDLQDAAVDLRPELGALLERGEAGGALRGLLSGSGPTCLFLCESADAARAVAGGLHASHDAVLVAPGPVAGAHVVEPRR